MESVAAAATLSRALLQRLHRCGEISAECCAAASELLSDSRVPLQLLRVAPLRGDEEAPLAFFRRSQDGAAGLLVLLDMCGGATQVALHPAPEMLASLAPDASHFRVHRQRITASRPTGAPPRSAPRAEPCEEAGEWNGSAYSVDELTHGELLAAAPAHGLLCLRLEPVPSAAHEADDTLVARQRLWGGLMRLACRPPERSAHSEAALLLRQLVACAGGGDDAADDETRGGLARLWRRLQPVPPPLLPLCGSVLGAALRMAVAQAPPGSGGDDHHHEAAGALAPDALRLTLEAARRIAQPQSPCATGPPTPPPRSDAESPQSDTWTGRGLSLSSSSSAGDDSPSRGHDSTSPPDSREPSPPPPPPPPPPPVKPVEAAAAAAAAVEGAQPAAKAAAAAAAAAAPPAAPAELRALCTRLHEEASEGVVVFVAPEMGRMCTVGGLGVMVEELATAIAAQGGRACVIAPAYEECRAQWEAADPQPLCDLAVPLGEGGCVGVRVLKCEQPVVPQQGPKGSGAAAAAAAAVGGGGGRLTVYLLRCAEHFKAPYAPAGTPWARLHAAVLLPRAALLLLHWLQQQQQPPQPPHHHHHLLSADEPPPDAPEPPFVPSAVISNDWVAALTAPYARHLQWTAACPGFGGLHHGAGGGAALAQLQEAWRGVPFVHLVHNLEEGYDGALELQRNLPLGALHALHQLPSHLLHDGDRGGHGGHGGGMHGGGMHGGVHGGGGVHGRGGGRAATHPTTTLHLSRAALLCANNWATVSTGYREQLLRHESAAAGGAGGAAMAASVAGSQRMAPLLRAYSAPFACASGIALAARRARLGVALAECGGGGDRAAAKAALQRRCFGEAGVRPGVPLLCFLGRIASQKGVHLLLDVLPALLRQQQQEGGAVQLLVCGQADPRDNYAQRCAAQMRALRAAHPLHFWAQPELFFEAGLLASAGADFGLMPSLFEPCGLVREEFFAAGTPLVASRTGGLSDRVLEYDERRGADGGGSGNGLFIEGHTHQAVLAALARALRLYRQPEHYAAMRRNAHASACDVAETARCWQAELARLRACLMLRQLDGTASLHELSV